MKTNTYLYGDVEVPKIPQNIIDTRVELLKVELNKELDKSYMNRDMTRLTDIANAIEFWEKLNDNTSN